MIFSLCFSMRAASLIVCVCFSLYLFIYIGVCSLVYFCFFVCVCSCRCLFLCFMCGACVYVSFYVFDSLVVWVFLFLCVCEYICVWAWELKRQRGERETIRQLCKWMTYVSAVNRCFVSDKEDQIERDARGISVTSFSDVISFTM